jgi:hypothetical protein
VDRQAKAAEHGDVFAQFVLAKRYHNGEGVDKDIAQALKWYRAAAKAGHIEAQFELAALLDTGAEGIEANSNEAYKWYSKAAYEGHMKAQSIISQEKWQRCAPKMQVGSDDITFAEPDDESYRERKPFTPEKLEKLLIQAEDGDVDAQYDLGIRYYNGEGVELDHKKAVEWFLRAAEHDDSQAQFNLGIMYGRGEGVQKDLKVSMSWLKKAADQGHEEALSLLTRKK